jgi:hypothetical protein
MKRIGIIISFLLLSLLAKTQQDEKIFLFPNNYLSEDTVLNPFNLTWQQRVKNQQVLVDSVFYYTWNSGTSEWGDYQSIVYTYNETGKLSRETYRQPSQGYWINTFYYEYSYNENDNLTEKTSKEWNNDTQEWNNSSFYQYTYNEKRKLEQYIWQKWDTAGFSWVNYAKYLYDYDLSGNWIYYERQNWDADSCEWKLNYRFLYNYENGVKIEFIRQNWDQSGLKWINNNKNTYEYDTNGNLEEETQFVWQTSSEEWVNSTLIIYLYDDNKLLIEKTYQVWSSNAWNNTAKYTYLYTDFGKESEIVFLLWNGSRKGWNNNYRYLYNYDEDQNLNQEIWQEWSSGNWENDYMIEYFLSSHPSPIYNLVTDNMVRIFPNPFNEKATIHFNMGDKVLWKLELADITGKKVIQMEKLSARTVTLTRGRLRSGIYILKISYLNRSLVRKVIIK